MEFKLAFINFIMLLIMLRCQTFRVYDSVLDKTEINKGTVMNIKKLLNLHRRRNENVDSKVTEETEILEWKMMKTSEMDNFEQYFNSYLKTFPSFQNPLQNYTVYKIINNPSFDLLKNHKTYNKNNIRSTKENKSEPIMLKNESQSKVKAVNDHTYENIHRQSNLSNFDQNPSYISKSPKKDFYSLDENKNTNVHNYPTIYTNSFNSLINITGRFNYRNKNETDSANCTNFPNIEIKAKIQKRSNELLLKISSPNLTNKNKSDQIDVQSEIINKNYFGYDVQNIESITKKIINVSISLILIGLLMGSFLGLIILLCLNSKIKNNKI